MTGSGAAFATTEEATTPGLLRDFVVDLFRILEHTPIYAMGMNHTLHFGLREGSWERLASQLAPGDVLKEQFRDIALGTVTWRIPRDDDLDGHISLKVEPSAKLMGGGWSEWNSHVTLSSPESAAGARLSVDVLQARWDDDRRRATATFEFLRSLA